MHARTHIYITRIHKFVKMTADCGINHKRKKNIQIIQNYYSAKYYNTLCVHIQYYGSFLHIKESSYRVDKLCTEVCS